MNFNIFISYSTKDIANVRQLEKLILNTGVELFVADHSLLPGEKISENIINAIEKCDLFILLWSKNAKTSEWVSQEIGHANAMDKFILPLVIGKNLALPGFIRDLKYLPIDENNEKCYEQVREVVLMQFQQKAKKSDQKFALMAIGAIIFWVLGQK